MFVPGELTLKILQALNLVTGDSGLMLIVHVLTRDELGEVGWSGTHGLHQPNVGLTEVDELLLEGLSKHFKVAIISSIDKIRFAFKRTKLTVWRS